MMKKTSTKTSAKKKLNKKVEKPSIDSSLVLVEATKRVLLRDGKIAVVGDTFRTDSAYAELLKKTYNFIITK
jgi:hypothetical protein